jgi:7-dehydrocholesterol reductase
MMDMEQQFQKLLSQIIPYVPLFQFLFFGIVADASPTFQNFYFEQTFCYVIYWVGFQWILYMIPNFLGQKLSKIGYSFSADTNGIQSWSISLIVLIILHLSGYFDLSLITENLFCLSVCCSIIGTIIGIVMYFVGGTDGLTNNSMRNRLVNFVMGQKLHPKLFGKNVKLFFNGRPGIIGWSVINLAASTYQYKTFGAVSWQLVLINLMQLLYVLDFFWNEKWYLGTIDMIHDKFGWYLTWGDCAWLPFMYTLQGTYACQLDPQISSGYELLALILCLGGYVIFRISNYQKDQFKEACKIGHHAVSISFNNAFIKTETGYLYTGGVWGWARHTNYLGDLLMAFSYGFVTGFNHWLPYFYFVFMLILLVSRCFRDEHRCKSKYGKYWDEYCKRVPYRLIKYVF